MTQEIRWRIIALQVVMFVVLAVGAVVAFWGSSFTNGQISSQLEPQKIFFPKDATETVAGLQKYPDLLPYAGDLQKYQGQQVVNGDQAHVYADAYLGLHIREIDNGKVYSELSTQARTEKDPVLKAEKNAMVQTAFRGETLRSMLNQAWAFSIFGTVALFMGWGLTAVALVVLGSIVYEVAFAKKRAVSLAPAPLLAPTPMRT